MQQQCYILLMICVASFTLFGQEEMQEVHTRVGCSHRLMPLGVGIPRPRRALARKGGKGAISDERRE